MVTTKKEGEYVPVDPNFRPLPKYGRYSELDPEFAKIKPIVDNMMENMWQPEMPFEDFRKAWLNNSPAPKGCPEEGKDVLTETRMIPVRDGAEIEIKLYKAISTRSSPAMVIRYHGGGWVVGGHCTEHSENLIIAAWTNSVVVSVNYRLAPEFRFPYALNDCFDALKWCSKNAELLGADGSKIIINGSSAGGNLLIICQASVVTIMAREEGIKGIIAQVLTFPITCHPKFFPTERYEMGSYQQNRSSSVVTAARMEWFLDMYMPEPTNDWRLSPLLAQSLKNLPPACELFTI
ncbi:esterase lipase thioesterase [Trichoderma arundinaceum]|uniref:Esterase lipase thioesterase n=1 Tax=Trichoderma arundinaceum TaxID=490622 RepID=A0A395NRA2_TRIAR|nr:esterase lipase thioesterase [Trichoderma arundinaceum]